VVDQTIAGSCGAMQRGARGRQQYHVLLQLQPCGVRAACVERASEEAMRELHLPKCGEDDCVNCACHGASIFVAAGPWLCGSVRAASFGTCGVHCAV
jgi:hypothetical protein